MIFIGMKRKLRVVKNFNINITENLIGKIYTLVVKKIEEVVLFNMAVVFRRILSLLWRGVLSACF